VILFCKITDQKDAPYLAVALAIEVEGILTQDKDFQKQKEIKIYALHDLFAML
jgi:predicted nucleic acid-binding protein